MKNIFLIGGSSREDAIAWKLNHENNIGNIYISPGNGGSFSKPKTRNIILNLNKPNDIKEFLHKEKISYIINNSPFCSTVELENISSELKIPIIGPDSKICSTFNSRIKIKNFLKKYNISSSNFEIVDNFKNLKETIEKFSTKKFIYSDIQKGFKGIYLIESKGQGSKILESIEISEDEKKGGFIVEPYQKGEEYSAILALDGSNYILFPILRIYPKSFDNDYGLYTSGMGCFTPSPTFSASDMAILNEKIIYPLIEGLKTEKLIYKGFLTIHFIKTNEKLVVINILPFFSNPEIETILPLMNSSFNLLCSDIISSNIINYVLNINPYYSVSVVIASKGYPLESEKGILIAGLDKIDDKINVFHNNTSVISYSKNRGFVTGGGRVLTVNGVGNSLEEARKKVYNILENHKIFFDGNFYRSDIGEKYCKK